MLTAIALGAESWPDAFRIECGDVRRKLPVDMSVRGTLVPMFSGEAVRHAGDIVGIVHLPRRATQAVPASVTGWSAEATTVRSRQCPASI